MIRFHRWFSLQRWRRHIRDLIFFSIVIVFILVYKGHKNSLNEINLNHILILTKSSKGESIKVGHSATQRERLNKLSDTVLRQSFDTRSIIPTIPCVSTDYSLIALSAAATRIRFGHTVTFVMVYYGDVSSVVPRTIQVWPTPLANRTLWAIYDDGAITMCYGYDHWAVNERVSLLDCPMTEHGYQQLWLYGKVLRVHLAALSTITGDSLLLKAFIDIPKPGPKLGSETRHQLTLCSTPSFNRDQYLVEWIEFHRLVGFQKFVIYNTTETNGKTTQIINTYAMKYPDLVDVVQWNFSSLNIIDWNKYRYFQVEAVHDCLIRYGDQSEWLGILDFDEYIVPLLPYQTVHQYLVDFIGSEAIGTLDFPSHLYCPLNASTYKFHERNMSVSLVEQFIHRAPTSFTAGRRKYLCRPRFVQYLGIHHQYIGSRLVTAQENYIRMAHYYMSNKNRILSGCFDGEPILDTEIRDRFAKSIRDGVESIQPDKYKA